MSVKRHTFYNLLGSVIPMLIGVVTVPLYLHLIGNARYGVLAIVWLFLGYFGLFDPGITRAALFHIARLGDAAQKKERESVFWTALAVNVGFGVVGGVILYFAARPLFMSTFKMPESMRGEVMASLPWLAASVPVSIITGVLGGALQAREEFGVFNVIYIFNAVITQLVPLAIAYFHGPDLTWLIPAVLISRALGMLPSFAALSRLLPLGVGGRYDGSKLKTLFSYGGWVTISNLINPILTSMDRMLIGSLMNAEAVAFYTVPFNLVTRVTILPGALSTSLFPKLSRSSLEDSARLASDAVVSLSSIMTPLVIGIIACLPFFMKLWVGSAFAVHAAPIGVVLMAGVWINSLAFIPSEHLQAINRPDLTAKFHAIEVIPFLLILWLGVHFFGLQGAAWAWTLRVTVDALLLFGVAGHIAGWRQLFLSGVLVLSAAIFVPKTLLSYRTVVEVILLMVAILWSWRTSPRLRAVIQNRFVKPVAQQLV